MTTFDDHIFLLDPSRWPGEGDGRICCLKRRPGARELPFEHGMIASYDLSTVYHHILPGEERHSPLKYVNLVELLEDWRVD